MSDTKRKTVTLENVVVFEDGVIRDNGGHVLAKLVDGVTFEDLTDPVKKAMIIIERYGGIDGEHHKTWVIDQVARLLTGGEYNRWVIEMKAGEDGPDTYDYDEGIAP